MVERIGLLFTNGLAIGDYAHPIDFAEGEQDRFLSDWSDCDTLPSKGIETI